MSADLGALRVAASALAGVLVSLAGSGLLLSQRDAEREAELGSAFVAAAMREVGSRRAATEALCARVERALARESPAGVLDRDELKRSLARALGPGELAYARRDGRSDSLVASGPEQALFVDPDALSASLTTELVAGERSPYVVSGCALEFSGNALVLLRADELAAFEASLGALATSLGLVLETAVTGVPRVALPPARGAVAKQYGVSWPRGGLRDVAPRVIGAALLVALLCAELARRVGRAARAREEDVLGTLDEAAQRVAQGDLSTAIARNLGGRADQTFRTFDRMTRELREMREKQAAAERAEAFREVARQLAHELKNPLFPIRTAVETLRRTRERAPAAFDEVFEETTRVVLEEVQRLERIVREFGAYARLPEPVLTRIDVASVLSDVAALHDPDQVSVRASGPRFVRADRELVMQVLVNLLLNALHAVAGRSNGRVELGCDEVGDAIVLHVDDNGPGVPEAERLRVFEPYVTTKPEGTGLGLAIARRIAEQHGGSLHVADSPLGGARFTLSLPARAQ